MRVDVTNRGAAAVEEVVQFYVRPGASRIKQPLKTLCRFERIRLEPGETRTIAFTIQVKDWAIWDVTRDRYCVEAGEYTLLAGASSADIRLEHPVSVQGEVIPPRQADQRICAENFDDCSNILAGDSGTQA
ncbi:fibronectin type III-like domain-contianing protein [Paenibacillus farraposensis]|uniref:Fibronectin type III-like domain-contianing protein n=1 Tax=Paenibacillus farraposensis TaxID=2807095 RepID=A0ABW4DCB4_9BACL|nr:fibronectin type III-like domain-contianing protein [Paenibacillus farraposensis]